MLEEAAEGIVNAYTGRPDDLFSYVPLAERRLFSIYGELPFLSVLYSGEHDVKVYEQQFSARVNGDRARLTIEELQIGVESREHGFDLFNGVTITGHCAEVRSEWTTDVSDSYYYEEWDRRDLVDSGCLSDIPLASEFGFDEIDVIAVKEGGGWFISPLATFAERIGTSRCEGPVAQLSHISHRRMTKSRPSHSRVALLVGK